MADVKQHAGDGAEQSFRLFTKYIQQERSSLADQSAQDPRHTPQDAREMDAQTVAAQSGSISGYGVSQQSSAQGKMFLRSDILAIIKAERARINGLFPEANPPDTLLREGAGRLAAPLLTIFENLE